MNMHLSVEKWLEAARRGDLDFVVDYLNRGMEVDACDTIDVTALMRAVEGCHIELIKLLLDRGASLTKENYTGYTAVTYGLTCARLYESYSKGVLANDPRPLELLLKAGGKFTLRESVMMNDVELARTRLDEGADPNTGAGTYCGPMLHHAAEEGYLDFVNLLLDYGANIEETDDLGQKPLLRAARSGQIEVVRCLLDRGADINATAWGIRSALTNAALEGHEELYAFLLAHGARRNFYDALSLGAFGVLERFLDEEGLRDSALDSIRNSDDRLATLAVRYGFTEAVQLLLDRGSALLDSADEHSLLAEAAWRGNLELIKMLFDRGADLHQVGTDGMTPLEWAVNECQDEAAAFLKSLGAER